MKAITISSIFFIILAFVGCNDDSAPKRPIDVRPLTAAEAEATKASNSFSFKIFQKLSSEENQNIFISPLSISMALGMTYNGADGSTKEAIQNTLGYENLTPEELNQAYKGVKDIISGIDNSIQVSIANSIWNRNSFNLQKDFISVNEKYYDAKIQSLDFNDPNSKDIINRWVSNNTNGKIPSIVDQITNDHVLFLVNAVYFKGNWTYKFNKSKTYTDVFQQEGGTSESKYMVLEEGKGKYLKYNDENSLMIDLPYGNGQFSMSIIMPYQSDLNTFISTFTEESFSALKAKLDSAQTELHLPKFSMSYEKKLNDVLTELGMGEAFSTQANFSKIFEGVGEGLTISEVKHKTYVDVNEEGTEAAGVTSVGIETTSMRPIVKINKPFVFIIREKSSDAVLFIGKFLTPSSNQ